MPEPSALRLQAHAKVNLALAVTGRRADGYHELRSLFLRLELADTLTVQDIVTDPADSDRLEVEGDPDCPVADNLVLRATDAFRAAAAARGVGIAPLGIGLTKRIPMAAGLAGGSTDAASMLRLLAARHPGLLSRAEVVSIAARVGADVPFFLDGAGAALVSGVGQYVEPLPPPTDPVGVLLCTPPVGASTPSVFRAWDQLDEHRHDDPAGTGPGDGVAARAVEVLAHLLRSGVDPGTLAQHAAELRAANDLWLPAASVTPILGPLRDALEQRLERPVLLTGSGSTLFALYASAEAADVVARGLRSEPEFAAVGVIATRSTGPRPTTITSWRDP
jgi:4-diphosphocytidyl-2-C-methyl-D-erythritol kinase